MILPVCHKSKYGVLTKNTLKDDISGIIEKDEDMVFLLTEKLKMIKKITQLNAQRSVCLYFAFTGINFRVCFTMFLMWTMTKTRLNQSELVYVVAQID